MTKSIDIHLFEDCMLRQLAERQIDFSPFELTDVQLKPRDTFPYRSDVLPDALMHLEWGGNAFHFVVENKIRFDSLQMVKDAIEQALRYAEFTRNHPMIYLPYLSRKTIRLLEKAKVSGFDLCGNIFILIPGQVYIERVDKPNRFPSSAPIKNIYQKNSSLVPRLFLLQPSFESITAIVDEITRRNGNLTQATVSKVCQRLEEDVILERRKKKTSLRYKETYLLQPETLLENLAEQYAPPSVTRHLTVKSQMAPTDLTERLLSWSNTTGEKIVLTGTVSCTAYTVMAREERAAFYCSHVARLLSDLNGIFEETRRFADIELIETNDQFVYFDQRDNLYASPIQSYLELMQGDKRDRQAAEMIAQKLLNQVRIAYDMK